MTIVTDRSAASGLTDVLRVLMLRWWLIVAATAIALVLAGLAILLIEPTYEVEVLLAPTSEDSDTGIAGAIGGQLGGLASFAGLDMGSGSFRTDQAVALLRSRALTGKFIEENGLMPILFPDEWDDDSGSWIAEGTNDSPPTLWMGIKTFEDLRMVTQDAQTGLVTLTITWTDPEQAAAWVSGLTAMVNAEMRSRAIEEATKSIAFLEEALKETNVLQLKQAVYGLIERQLNTLMMADVREQYVFKVLGPPIVPDLDDPTSPRPLLVFGLGAVAGLMLGVLLALSMDSIAQARVGYRADPPPQ
jgi:uncharacterized protein involved in exopolysaccharide biosynthesis